MSEQRDLEHLLWDGPDGSVDLTLDSAEVRVQRDVHRLLLMTVSARSRPGVSPGFDAALARRRESPPAWQPLAGGPKTLMRVYWLLLLVATGAALWQLDLQAPTPSGPLGVAFLFALIPLSFYLALSGHWLSTLVRITRFLTSS